MTDVFIIGMAFLYGFIFYFLIKGFRELKQSERELEKIRQRVNRLKFKNEIVDELLEELKKELNLGIKKK